MGSRVVVFPDFLKIPKKAALLLFEILDKMAQGKSFTLIPSDFDK